MTEKRKSPHSGLIVHITGRYWRGGTFQENRELLLTDKSHFTGFLGEIEEAVFLGKMNHPVIFDPTELSYEEHSRGEMLMKKLFEVL